MIPSSTHFSEGDNRNETKSETQGRIPVQIMSYCRDWDKQQ
jgi:hypothetical protein